MFLQASSVRENSADVVGTTCNTLLCRQKSLPFALRDAKGMKSFSFFFLKKILLSTRVRDNILKSKEQKNIQPTKGGHKMVTCQNYVSLFYCQITSCPSDGGIS